MINRENRPREQGVIYAGVLDPASTVAVVTVSNDVTLKASVALPDGASPTEDGTHTSTTADKAT